MCYCIKHPPTKVLLFFEMHKFLYKKSTESIGSVLYDEFREIFIERVRDCQPPPPYLELM